jgi:transcriptional regulator with XRE-family HTH domain
MQELSHEKELLLGATDNSFMPRRPSSKPRPPMGARLTQLRLDANLTQEELGRLVGVPQGVIAFWENSSKPPRSEVLVRMAAALGVRIEALLDAQSAPTRRGGPVGKVRKAFEAVSRLPRRQQEKILEVVEALVYKSGRNGATR